MAPCAVLPPPGPPVLGGPRSDTEGIPAPHTCSGRLVGGVSLPWPAEAPESRRTETRRIRPVAANPDHPYCLRNCVPQGMCW